MSTTVHPGAATPTVRPQHRANRTLSWLWAIVTLAIALLAPRAAEAAPFLYKNVMASKVLRTTRTLNAGTTYRFETGSLSSSSCDPVMYLYRSADFANARNNDNLSSTSKNSRITVAITSATAGLYDIVVRGKSGSCTCNLILNGTTILTGQSFAGSLITLAPAVPASPTWVEYQTASIRNGSPDTRIWGINSNGNVVAFSDEEGVGHMSRFNSQTTRSVLVSSFSNLSVGPTDLYINPINDQIIYDEDLDGLADLTEAEIGTCAQMPCSTTSLCATDAADTDHDGLFDNEEIFGRDDPQKLKVQTLPLWGANPKHKDVFVEWDWVPALGGNPFFAADADSVANWFKTASVSDMMNPDGLDGISVHIDLGIANGSGSTTYGDWGGSNADVVAPDWTDSWKNAANFNPLRIGLFRHAIANNGTSGQAAVSHRYITWPYNPTDHGVGLFVHELGHSLGLEHHGHNKWGGGNCKPNYVSTMNYLFIGGPFSRGNYSGVSLTPSAVSEAQPFGAIVPSHIAQAPLSFPVFGTYVNWNRDFGSERLGVTVRAPLRWSPGGAPGGGCDPFIANSTRFSSGIYRFGRQMPELVKYNNRLYMFYISSDRLAYRSAPIGGQDANGSWCTTPNCATWTDETILSTPGTDVNTGVSGVTATPWGNGLVLAYRLSNQQVRWQQTNAPGPNGTLPNWNSNTNLGVMDATPNLTVMYVNPAYFANANEVVALFGSTGGRYRRWTLMTNLGGLFAPTDVMDTSHHPLDGTFSPTIVSWPSRGGANHADIGTSCGVFINQFWQARFYCFDKATDRWQDFSTKMYQWIPMPVTVTKVGLAYHVLRNGTGGALGDDPTQGSAGQFWMTVAPPADSNGDGVPDQAANIPQLYISTTLSAGAQPNANITQWAYTGNYWDYGRTVDTGTNVGLYEDESISAMKGTWFENNQSILFMPYADGTSQDALKDGNDYQVMERGICMGVLGGSQSLAETVCGNSNFFGY